MIQFTPHLKDCHRGAAASESVALRAASSTQTEQTRGDHSASTPCPTLRAHPPKRSVRHLKPNGAACPDGKTLEIILSLLQVPERRICNI